MSEGGISAREAGRIFEETAELLELRGENQFRVRAYETAARLLLSQTMTVDLLLREIAEGKMRGIGSGLQEALREIAETGSSALLVELREEFPRGVRELLRVAGLGPKKVKLLSSELGIDSLETLLAACAEGRLLDVRGFSEKTQERIKDAASLVLENRSKMLLPQALGHLERILQILEAEGGADALPAGEARRAMPIVSSLELVVPVDSAEALALKDLEPPITLTTCAAESLASALLFATGSEAHVRELVERAATRGFELRPEGLFRKETRVPLESEDELYSALELAFVPPELREGRGEIEEAARLFSEKKSFRLVEESDLRGVLHVHSTYSDGKNTIRELADEAIRLGYAYLGITDHSQSAAYAGGLKEPVLRKQREEIARLNAELAPFRIFHGIESDILADGSLDYPPEVLAEFDFIIASVHSRFSLDRDAMTKRLLRAVENPATTILGHMSGRKLLEREGYEVDHEAILRRASECGVAVEVNANPRRLDVDWQYLRLAAELGVRIPICPDAHSLSGFADVRWGVAMARKGGLRPDQVPNCSSLVDFEKWLEASRSRRQTFR